MAAYTPVSKVIGTTGASGAAGYGNLVTAQNTAVATAVTAALAATGYQPQTLQISNASLVSDVDGTTMILQQTLTYMTLV